MSDQDDDFMCEDVEDYGLVSNFAFLSANSCFMSNLTFTPHFISVLVIVLM